MQSLEQYRKEFEVYLFEKIKTKEPRNLYDPILYILKLGGKRMRPVMVLLSTEIFGKSYKSALDAALAIEVFHNFSLVHDDIMDDAPLRRGKKTVHEVWDLNTGILSGDAMLINAYQLFENYEDETFKKLAKLFTKTAIEVCEGQQYDIDFETRDQTKLEEYLKMIEFKTAVLVGAALEMGAIIAGAAPKDQKAVYEFGKLLGIAFQLQDDYLDAFGDAARFGKQIGGDIIENKNTFLYITSLQQASSSEAAQLEHLFTINPPDPSQKIETVKGIFQSSGAVKVTKQEIENYTQKAFAILDSMEINPEKKSILRHFGQSLMEREV